MKRNSIQEPNSYVRVYYCVIDQKYQSINHFLKDLFILSEIIQKKTYIVACVCDGKKRSMKYHSINRY